MEKSANITSETLLKSLAEVSKNFRNAINMMESENNHLEEIHAALRGKNAEFVREIADSDSETKLPALTEHVRRMKTADISDPASSLEEQTGLITLPELLAAEELQTPNVKGKESIVDDGTSLEDPTERITLAEWNVAEDIQTSRVKGKESIGIAIDEFGQWSSRGPSAMTKDHLYDNIIKSVSRPENKFPRNSTFFQDYAAMQGWLHGHSKRKNGGALAKLGTQFDSMCAIIIVLNSVFLAIATDYSARNKIGEQADLPVMYIVLDYAFGIWFLIELILRICAEGPISFFSCFDHSGSCVWNYFDTMVVLVYFVEVIFGLLSTKLGGANITTLRLLRVLRIARALRVVRVLRIFKELRLMVMSVLNSFMTLFWAMLLLSFLFLTFAILLTENVNSYLYKSDDPGALDARGLEHDFGSIDHAVYTLFSAVTGGRSWQEVSDQLFKMNWTSGVLFCFYIFFTNFAMLNIITGIFLESALSSCKSDHSELIKEQLTAENSSIKALQTLFEAADEDHSGDISAAEFDKHLGNPMIRAHLTSLGVHSGEAEGLFRLLDLDDSGVVSLEEFLYGCMRMKGDAKAVDVATLMYENKKMFGKWCSLTKYIKKQFELRKSFEDRLVVVLDTMRPQAGETLMAI